MSPVASRMVAKEILPCRRNRTIRPATAARWSASCPGSKPSNSKCSPAASAVLSNRRANGSTPAKRSRSSFSRRAARTSWSRPPCSPPSGWPVGSTTSLIPAGVLLVDQPEPLQGEPRLVVVDGLAEREDRLGQPSGDHHGGAAAELLLHPLDHPVDFRGGAEQQPGLDALNGVLPDDRAGRAELHPGEPRRFREQRPGGDPDAGRDRTAQVCAAPGHRDV